MWVLVVEYCIGKGRGGGEGNLSFWKIEDGVFKCEGLKNSENHNREDKQSEDG